MIVAMSAVGLAGTMLIPIVLPTWNAMLVYTAFNGAFFDISMAIDLALMSMVLPVQKMQVATWVF